MKFAATALSLLFAALLPAQQPSTEGTLRIGTWNLEFLGAAGNFRNNLPPRDDADFAKIGRKVKDLGVAVLAVQEICGSDAIAKVCASAGPSWKFVLGTTGGWDDGKTSQQIGFLWDADVVDLVMAEELLQLSRQAEGLPIFHRVPVTAAFKVKATGFDFRATTVHLKAGQKKEDEQKRRLEATALREWFEQLQQRPGEDEDRVLLGDFNCSFGASPEAILEKDRLLTWLEPSRPTPTIMHFADPIDQIAVAPGFGELRADSFTVDGDFDGLDRDVWRKTYSDHFPVTVEIAATTDADPDATFARGGDEHALPPKNRPAVAYPAARNAANTKGSSVRWPPAVGTQVQVRSSSGFTTGRLEHPLPDGPGGFVVIATENGVRAFPLGQVEWIQLQ